MEVPLFIHFFSERIGKPVSTFTKNDWQQAAMNAAEILADVMPMPKEPGRPKKRKPLNTLVALLGPSKRPIGRPLQRYGVNRTHTIQDISNIVFALLDSETRKRWPQQSPRNKTEAVRQVLRAIGSHAGYAEAILRSMRGMRKQSSNNL